MTFLHPWILWAGLGVSLLVVLGSMGHARRRRRLAAFMGGRRGAARVSSTSLYRIRIERVAVLLVAVLLLAAAAAEPRRVDASLDGAASPSVSLVLAIDVSASMQANDVVPTRLAEAVRIARDILSEAEGTRVGLILFAGKSYTLAPLTGDIGALRFLLEGVTPTIVSAQDPGSLLSAGIRSAGGLFRDEPVTAGRAVILITDGESGETDPEVIAAVREVVEVGATVHTIGVGTLRGGQMTLSDGNFPIGMQVRDLTGAPSVSRLQEPLLQRISQVGQGEYAHAEDRGALGGVYRSLRPSAFSGASTVAGVGSDPSAAFAWVGLFLLFLEGLLELRLRRKHSGEGGGS